MKKLFLTFLLLTAVIAGMAQERKKVAVVLSGGGAKGMAHIGALRVIEKAGIPIDIVTGTSMGSIVGGLYALGYNSDVLDSIVRVQDWKYVISDRENLDKQSLDDRKKQYTYILTRGLTFGKHNESEGGLIKGKNLAELFDKLCVGYTDSLDFSHDLPLPFSCVATNIVDNSEVDFHSGRIQQAMRASMAIPAVFSPVRIGDMVLVDGGLRNNYPVDVAREMGADIVIGVTVQGEAKMAEDMGRAMSIIGQIVDVNCKNKYDENLAITDVHIKVNTEGYNAASFTPTAIDTLIRRGEEAAMNKWDEIVALKARIGIDDSFQPVRLTPLKPEIMKEKHRVNSYVFNNMTKLDERFLREKFKLKEGDSIDTQREQQLTTSMRIDLFYLTAECHTVPDGDGVRVELTAGDRKDSQVSVGLRYDTEEHASLQLNADFPIANAEPLDADFTLRLGKRIMGQGVLTLHSHYFTQPQVAFTAWRNDIDVYSEGDRDYNIIYNQYQTDIIPIRFTVKNFDLTLGARWDYFHYKDKLLSSHSVDIPLKDDHYFSYRATINYNSQDDWICPTRGSRFKAQYAYLTDNLTQLEGNKGLSDLSAHWATALPIGSSFVLQPLAYGRMLFGSSLPYIFYNAVGGQWFGSYVEQQMPFVGMGRMEYVDRHFVALQMQGQQRLATNHYILLSVVGAYEAGKLKELFDHKMNYGCQAAYMLNTMLGPIAAYIGYSNKTKEPYFYINIGFHF